MQDALTNEPASSQLVHEVLLVPCRKVRPFPGQPRTYFNLRSLRELADSIAEIGQTTPCLVRRLDPPEDGYDFELVEGERRFRCCVMLGRLLKIEVDPNVGDNKKQFKKSVAANFGYEGHTPVECARIIQRLRADGETIEAVSRIMLRSVTWVNQYSTLLKLDPETLALLEPEKTPEEKLIAVNVALQLVGVPMPTQLELAKRISELRLSMDQARHLIKVTLSDKGIQSSNAFRPAREFGRMTMTVDKSVEHVTSFLETSRPQMELMLRRAGLQRRMKLLEQSTQLAKKAADFEKGLRKILEGL
jgi:ParB/RepB/Spo0J family partition protein